jgi:predicted hydrocarbon binding protein
MNIERRADPMLELPITEAHMRWALEAVEEVAGNKGLAVILRQAGLEKYIDQPPPNELVFAGCTFEHYAELNHAILDFYGRAAGSFARRIGRLSARNMIEQQDDLLGLQALALRAMGTELRVKLGLMSSARLFVNLYRRLGGIDVTHIVEDHGDHFTYSLKECPCCAGMKADRPICSMWLGVLYEGGIYVTDGKVFEYQEVACRALGDEFCTFKVGKVAVNA